MAAVFPSEARTRAAAAVGRLVEHPSTKVPCAHDCPSDHPDCTLSWLWRVNTSPECVAGACLSTWLLVLVVTMCTHGYRG